MYICVCVCVQCVGLPLICLYQYRSSGVVMIPIIIIHTIAIVILQTIEIIVFTNNYHYHFTNNYFYYYYKQLPLL